MSMEFEGKQRMIDRIDNAIFGDCPFETTTCLRRALLECIADPGIHLPEQVYIPSADDYTRREVFTHPEKGYSVIALTWGPGQGTPIHDHNGMWCVEGVWSGSIRVASYHVTERDGDRYRFEEVGTVTAASGSAGSLIPPHEFHTIRNPDSANTAVSIHIYKRPLTTCHHFSRQDDGWYTRKICDLPLVND